MAVEPVPAQHVWSSGWPDRIRGGDTGASKASCSASAITSPEGTIRWILAAADLGVGVDGRGRGG
jgi:hypothetical protein